MTKLEHGIGWTKIFWLDGDRPTEQDKATLAAALAADPAQGASGWPDVAEDDPEVVIAARAIAEHGIGQPWDDFLPTNVYDVDHRDLIEYGRAAVAALRSAARSPADILAGVAEQSGAGAPETSVRCGAPAALVSNAEPALKQLGARLADLLDDDHWNNIEPLLLEIAGCNSALASRSPAGTDDQAAIEQEFDGYVCVAEARIAQLEALVESARKSRMEECESVRADAAAKIRHYVDTWRTFEGQHNDAANAEDCDRGGEEWMLHREAARIYKACADMLSLSFSSTVRQPEVKP